MLLPRDDRLSVKLGAHRGAGDEVLGNSPFLWTPRFCSGFGIQASAQDYAGPLLPHVGGQITTAFANRFGPDAEGYFTFTAVTPELLNLSYSSTRGLNTRRNILGS